MTHIPVEAYPVYGRMFYAAFIVFFIYFVLLVLYYLLLALIGFVEGKKRFHESEGEARSAISASAVTIPITVIIPARNEEEWIADSLLAVLKLDYPKYEVIVVDDGSTDRTFEILDNMLELVSFDITYVKQYPDGRVREIFKSKRYDNVTVISKAAGYKKAGAVNAGLNLAKHEYICVIDADTILEPDALVKIMPHIQREPARIIGAGSYFGLLNGFDIKDGIIVKRSFSYKPLIAYQNLEYIRSFIGNRIAWSRFNAMPTVAGGFGIWRRDILYKLGGYDKNFTCEDMEFTFRAHDYIIKEKSSKYKILMLPHFVGWTEGPGNIRSFIIQRNRWQRVTNETVWKYKYMTFNPKYNGFAFLILPYFILYEVLGVFFETASIFMLLLGAVLGILDIRVFITFFSLMILSQTFISLLCVLSFLRGQKLFRLNYVLYLIALSFLEFFWYRWLIYYAKISGMRDYLKGIKTPDQYIREKRHP